MSVSSPVIDHWDGVTRRIYLKSGITSFHWIEDIYKEYRNWRRVDESSRKWLPFMRAAGNDPKGGSKFTPRYITLLDGARVIPYDENILIEVKGEAITDNANVDPDPFDTSTRTQPLKLYITPPASELVRAEAEIAAVNRMSFGGGVTIDVVNGMAGTGGLQGNQEFPSNNLADALTIAVNNAFNTLFIKGSLTLANGDDVSFYNLRGQDRDTTNLTLEAGCVTTAVNIYDIAITGTCGGRMNIHRGHLSNMTDLCASGGNANIIDCHLMGSIQLRELANAAFNFTNCVGANGVNAPVIDINGCAATIHFTDFAGLLTLENGTNPAQHVGLDVNSAKITLASSITQGMYGIRGIATVFNNTTMQTGLTVDISGTVNSDAAIYKDTVYFDAVDGSAGTSYPVGTFENPVNNVADMLLLSHHKNLNTLHFHSDATLPAGTNIGSMIVEAHNTFLHTLTLEAGVLTENTVFKNVKITGILDGPASFESCFLQNATNVEGVAHNTLFHETITLKDSPQSSFQLTTCRSYDTGHAELHVGQCMVNCGGWIGMLKILDKADAVQEVNLGISLGHVIIDSSCTAGNIYIGGSGSLLDLSTGSVVFDGLVNLPTIAEAVRLNLEASPMPVNMTQVAGVELTGSGMSGDEWRHI